MDVQNLINPLKPNDNYIYQFYISSLEGKLTNNRIRWHGRKNVERTRGGVKGIDKK